MLRHHLRRAFDSRGGGGLKQIPRRNVGRGVGCSPSGESVSSLKHRLCIENSWRGYYKIYPNIGRHLHATCHIRLLWVGRISDARTRCRCSGQHAGGVLRRYNFCNRALRLAGRGVFCRRGRHEPCRREFGGLLSGRFTLCRCCKRGYSLSRCVYLCGVLSVPLMSRGLSRTDRLRNCRGWCCRCSRRGF